MVDTILLNGVSAIGRMEVKRSIGEVGWKRAISILEWNQGGLWDGEMKAFF